MRTSEAVVAAHDADQKASNYALDLSLSELFGCGCCQLAVEIYGSWGYRRALMATTYMTVNSICRSTLRERSVAGERYARQMKSLMVMASNRKRGDQLETRAQTAAARGVGGQAAGPRTSALSKVTQHWSMVPTQGTVRVVVVVRMKRIDAGEQDVPANEYPPHPVTSAYLARHPPPVPLHLTLVFLLSSSLRPPPFLPTRTFAPGPADSVRAAAPRHQPERHFCRRVTHRHRPLSRPSLFTQPPPCEPLHFSSSYIRSHGFLHVQRSHRSLGRGQEAAQRG